MIIRNDISSFTHFPSRFRQLLFNNTDRPSCLTGFLERFDAGFNFFACDCCTTLTLIEPARLPAAHFFDGARSFHRKTILLRRSLLLFTIRNAINKATRIIKINRMASNFRIRIAKCVEW